MVSIFTGEWVSDKISQPFSDSEQQGPCNPYKLCNLVEWNLYKINAELLCSHLRHELMTEQICENFNAL